MEEGVCLASLPNEIIHKILRKLSFSDINNVTAVSRQFRQLGSHPSLWSQYCLQIHHRNKEALKNLEKILDLPRFEDLCLINVSGQQLTSDMCHVEDLWRSLRYILNLIVHIFSFH